MLSDEELQPALAMVATGCTTAELAQRFDIAAWRWVDCRLQDDHSRGLPPHPQWFAVAPRRQGVHAGRSLRDEHFGGREQQEIRDRISEVQADWDPQTEQSRRLSYASDLPGPRHYGRRPRQWDDICRPSS
jgi:hypothetical protein